MTAVADELAAKPKRKPGNPNWHKGMASPNPSGQPKSYAENRAMLKELFPKALEVLKRQLDSDNEDIAHRAAKLVAVYTLGKEPEPSDVQHAEARARLTTLIGVQVPVPSLPAHKEMPSLPAPPPEPEMAARSEAGTTPSLTTAELQPAAPPEAAGSPPSVSEPSGLRCIYKQANGQPCDGFVSGGKFYCEPHQAKLFALVGL